MPAVRCRRPIRPRRLSLPVLSWGLCLLLAASVGEAQADPFHHRNLLIGDRAIGLAGAYVALADDTSGSIYNPAGLVLSREEASASINTLTAASTRFEGFFPDGTALSQTASGLVPGYFGILRHGRSTTYAFSIAVADYASLHQSDAAHFALGDVDVEEFINSDVDYRHYLAGPSLAWRIDRRWSVGLSLFGSYRDRREARAMGGTATRASDTGALEQLTVLTSYRIEDEQVGLQPVLGVQFRDGPISLGLAASHDFALDRDYDYFYRSARNQSVLDPATGELDILAINNPASQSGSQHRQDQPWRFSAGAAWRIDPSWLVTGQVDYHTAVHREAVAGADPDAPPVTRRQEAVLNYAVAVEYALTADVALRGGLFTDFSNAEVDDAGPYEAREDIDLYGISLACAFRMLDRRFQVGIYARSGQGRGTLGDLGELDFSGSPVVDAKTRDVVVFFGATL